MSDCLEKVFSRSFRVQDKESRIIQSERSTKRSLGNLEGTSSG